MSTKKKKAFSREPGELVFWRFSSMSTKKKKAFSREPGELVFLYCANGKKRSYFCLATDAGQAMGILMPKHSIDLLSSGSVEFQPVDLEKCERDMIARNRQDIAKMIRNFAGNNIAESTLVAKLSELDDYFAPIEK